jgi:hypothetical protein
VSSFILGSPSFAEGRGGLILDLREG